VIGVGGYASVGAVAAALTLGIPTALLEPNALPGRANRLLGRFAKRIFVAFEDAIPYFPAGRAVLTGRPVRALPRAEVRSGDALRLLITGASQGARSVNRAIAAALPKLAQIPKLAITHQTGQADLGETAAAYNAAGVRAEVAAFFDDLPERMARADLVVARSGGTVAEICVAGVASVLVPYPYAADDHQMANARALERPARARWCRTREAAAGWATSSSTSCATRRGARAGRRRLSRARPDAAADIWQACGSSAMRRRVQRVHFVGSAGSACRESPRSCTCKATRCRAQTCARARRPGACASSASGSRSATTRAWSRAPTWWCSLPRFPPRTRSCAPPSSPACP
jgi:UDP-N-acetylglucosamine--N-acetylmuramyl-(pentapeptide) pyrophosphoryl-undecaprenol N-acetylglucosamine transferase